MIAPSDLESRNYSIQKELVEYRGASEAPGRVLDCNFDDRHAVVDMALVVHTHMAVPVLLEGHIVAVGIELSQVDMAVAVVDNSDTHILDQMAIDEAMELP